MRADEILYAPVPDYRAELKTAIRLRREKYDPGTRFILTVYGVKSSIAHVIGAWVFGCPCPTNYGDPIDDAHHHPDCVCEAIRDADVLGNLDAGRGLFDGAHDASTVRQWIYGDCG